VGCAGYGGVGASGSNGVVDTIRDTNGAVGYVETGYAGGGGPGPRGGLCFSFGPMVNGGSKNVIFDRDGWTVRTKTGKPSAHFEHCVAIRDGKADILSSFDFIKEVLVDREF